MRINPISTNYQSASNKKQSNASSPSFTAWKFKTSKIMLLMRPCDPEKYTLKISSAISKVASKLDEMTKGYDLIIHHKNKGSYEYEELAFTLRKSVPPKNTVSETLTDRIRPYSDTGIMYEHLGDADLDTQILECVEQVKKDLSKDKRKTFLDDILK